MQLKRAAIQAYVKKPLKEEKDRDTLLWVGAGYLLDVAQLEKQQGISAYRSTLAATTQMISRDREVRIASALLRRGFEDVAEVLLNQFVTLTITNSNEYQNSLEELPSLAATQTHQSGNSGALNWVSKIKDLSVQAEALSKMLIVLNPLPEQERELILRGGKTHGAQVSSQFSLPGYMVSQNFSEFE